MPDELVDICDESNNLLGIRRMKDEAHKKGLWHRAAHVWIYSSKAELLLQLRAKDKLFYPDVWDVSVAGHVSAGEEPAVSAVRELEEEIGLKVKKEELKLLKIVKFSEKIGNLSNNEFFYVYLLKRDFDATALKVQASELQEVRFFPAKELKRMMTSHPEDYAPHYRDWFEIIDEVLRRSA